MSARSLLLQENGEPRWPSLLAIVLTIAVVAWLESCAAMKNLGRRGGDDILKFSHAAHAEHVKDCKTCHFDNDQQKVVAAGHALCVQCHPSAVDDKPAEDACLQCHHTFTPKAAKKAERPDYSKANFDHESHATLDCAQCHGNVNKTGPGGRINFPRMEECVACHFPNIGEVSSAGCFTCHFKLDAKTIPESHKKPDWKETAHGFMSNNDPATCRRCHEPARDCETCHKMDRPKSHTAAFRAKTHGFHARDNPTSCEVCHAQEFCEACHRTTEPISHTGSFKGRPFLHCATCHLPLDEGNTCSVCHEGNPHERVIADPPPPALVARGLIDLSEPCLPCHPVDLVPIPHPYQSISALDCITCHRPL